LVDVDEFEGVGEEGREGVGVTAVLLDDRWTEVGDARVRLGLLGVLGVLDAGDEAGDGSLMSGVRC
jgi:hypothetical protein